MKLLLAFDLLDLLLELNCVRANHVELYCM